MEALKIIINYLLVYAITVGIIMICFVETSEKIVDIAGLVIAMGLLVYTLDEDEYKKNQKNQKMQRAKGEI